MRKKAPKSLRRITLFIRIDETHYVAYMMMHMHAYGDTHIAHNKFSYTPQQRREGLDMKADRPTGGFVVWRFHPSCVTSAASHIIYKALNFCDATAREVFSLHGMLCVCLLGFILHQSTESPLLIGLTQLFVYFSILHPQLSNYNAHPLAVEKANYGNYSPISNSKFEFFVM
jgi:hypothetical protein